MAAPEVSLREATYVHLYAKMLANEFEYNDNFIEQAWAPKNDSEADKIEDGVLYVIASMSDREIISRGQAYRHEVPIYLLFQKRLINSQDINEVDRWANLVHEYIESIRLEFDFVSFGQNYGLSRVEFYKDSSSPETAISPIGVRQGLFETTVVLHFYRGAA